MKKTIFVSFCLFSGLSFGQKSIDSVTIIQLGYDPIELGNQTADCLKPRTSEEKEWFKSTFIHKRGQFKIPDKPIADPFEEKE
jgi:hypothetical protein